MRRLDEDQRVHYRLFRVGPDHQRFEALLHCGQTFLRLGLLRGSPDGR